MKSSLSLVGNLLFCKNPLTLPSEKLVVLQPVFSMEQLISSDPESNPKLTLAFGDRINSATVESLHQKWATRDFKGFSGIENLSNLLEKIRDFSAMVRREGLTAEEIRSIIAEIHDWATALPGNAIAGVQSTPGHLEK